MGREMRGGLMNTATQRDSDGEKVDERLRYNRGETYGRLAHRLRNGQMYIFYNHVYVRS